MFSNKKRYEHIVTNNDAPKKNVAQKTISVLLFILSVGYIIIPYDFDKGVVGKIDDFFFFMAAFCNMYACFLEKHKLRVAMLLKVISGAFCVLGAMSLVLISLFLK